MPQLTDSTFRRSVVLMLEHGESGSMGLVINRGASLTLGDLAKNQSLTIAPQRTSQPVFMGGPVENHRGFVLHNDERVTEKHEVVPGLYLSLTLDTLGPLLKDPQPHLRFCLGYANWGPSSWRRSWPRARGCTPRPMRGPCSRAILASCGTAR